MTPSKFFLYSLLSFISGIFIASFVGIPELLVWEFFILGLFYFCLAFFQKSADSKKRIFLFAICLVIFSLGIFRYQFVNRGFENSELKKIADNSQVVEILGKISREPDVRENGTKVTIKIEKINGFEAEGKVLVTLKEKIFYYYDDQLKINGLLKSPGIFEDFNYQEYLKKDNISGVIYDPEIELVSENQEVFLYSKLLLFKNKLRKTLEKNLPYPQDSILGAILLGDKQKISSELKEKLNAAGVRHITAISGMHIIILSMILTALFIGIGIGRKRVFYFVAIILGLYIVMAGFQPSALRAGIMAFLLLLSQKINRPSNSSRTVVLAGALMLALNPFLLRYDVGFQLSFLAVVGIIYLFPIFENWLKFIPEERVLNLRSILSATLSSQVFTLPILIYNFGYFSLVGPLANILIVPILPYIMIGGFVFLFLGFVSSLLAGIFSWPVLFLLKYLTSLVSLFSSMPLALITFRVSWVYLFSFYLILISFIYYHFSKLKSQ